MKTYYILMVMNIALFALPVIAGCSRLHHLDRPLRIFLLLLVISFCGESLAYVAAFRYHMNYPVYNLLSILEAAVTALYFNYRIRSFQRYHIGFVIAFISIAVGAINLLYFQPITSMATHYLYYQSVIIIPLSLTSMASVLLPKDDLSRNDITHFWIAAAMLFFWCISLPVWGFYNYLTSRLGVQKSLVNYFLLTICYITNLSYTIILFRHPKNKSNVQ